MGYIRPSSKGISPPPAVYLLGLSQSVMIVRCLTGHRKVIKRIVSCLNQINKPQNMISLTSTWSDTDSLSLSLSLSLCVCVCVILIQYNVYLLHNILIIIFIYQSIVYFQQVVPSVINYSYTICIWTRLLRRWSSRYGEFIVCFFIIINYL